MKSSIDKLCDEEIKPVEIASKIDYNAKDVKFQQKAERYIYSIYGSLLGLCGLAISYDGISLSERDPQVIGLGPLFLAAGLTSIGNGLVGPCIESLVQDHIEYRRKNNE